MPTLQATSQQAWLPALTPGNMKITETITHVRIHPSVAEGQSLLAFPTASDYVFNYDQVFLCVDNVCMSVSGM